MATPKIRVLRLAHVHYQHPDLERAIDFLNDFGLEIERREATRVYLRGYGVQPYLNIAEQSPDTKRHFMGGAWVVESYADLEAACSLQGASQIQDNPGPGGGKIVSVLDPNGMFVHFVYGQELREIPAEESLPAREITSPVQNGALKKDRKGDFRRFTPGPSPVHKLGHYGYGVPRPKFQETLNWYTSTLNLKPTDSNFNPITNEDETCFMHIDLGREYTDHHSFFLAATDAPSAFVHHSSYEVNDFDNQSLGHNWLEKKGWKNCWGIGRHVLGSQIFDYWFDASGNIVEHYCDGDLVNQDTPWSRHPAGPDSIHVWGPDLPLAFVTGRLEDAGMPLVQPPDVLGGNPAEFRDVMKVEAVAAKV